MQLPKIRIATRAINIATRAINIAGRYISVAGLCDAHACGKPATTVACFTIRNNEPTALLLCQACAEEFAECEAGGDYLLITIAEVVKMAKERQAQHGRPTKYSQKRILTWLAAQPQPARAQELSDVFGSDRPAFRSLMNRWAKTGLVERVEMPSLHKNQRPGVGYRVAT